MRTAAISSAVFAYFLAQLINFRLDVGLNTFHLLNRVLDLIYPLTSIGENDIEGINIYRSIWEYMPKSVPKIAVVEDITINANVSVRLYRPHPNPHKDNETQLPPLIIYFHGGGFVIGSIHSVEHIAAGLAKRTNFIVASVTYRLAPENKFPAAPEDCITATKWIYDQYNTLGFDKSRIIVSGDSAGGNLAAIVAQQLPSMVAFQFLIYPTIPTLGEYSPAAFQNRNAPILNSNLMTWFRLKYYRDYRDLKHPLACPLNGPGLSGLPPALIITAEFDPLRDEGEEYARLLQLSGNKVTCVRYNNTVHGFFGYDFITHGVRALDESASHLVEYFQERN